jgi:L-lactate dehydrogenase complex protein LldG
MSRAEILSKVRKSLDIKEPDAVRQAAVDERIANPPRAPAPDRVAAPGTDLIAGFIDELEKQLATVVEVDSVSDIPGRIADYLKTNNQPLKLRFGNEPYFESCNWSEASAIEIDRGPAQPTDSSGLSLAFAGVAETGTMALQSGPENPVTLGFLPDTHIIVVPRSRIVATYEDAFAQLRHANGKGVMPRTLNLISGPSRTADIGGRIVIGAHGPRRLLALIAADL